MISYNKKSFGVSEWICFRISNRELTIKLRFRTVSLMWLVFFLKIRRIKLKLPAKGKSGICLLKGHLNTLAVLHLGVS